MSFVAYGPMAQGDAFRAGLEFFACEGVTTFPFGAGVELFAWEGVTTFAFGADLAACWARNPWSVAVPGVSPVPP